MNRATSRLRKKIREQKRNATKIKEIAELGLSTVGNTKVTAATLRSGMKQLFQDIADIATLMDARTGTIDPTAKKEEQ